MGDGPMAEESRCPILGAQVGRCAIARSGSTTFAGRPEPGVCAKAPQEEQGKVSTAGR